VTFHTFGQNKRERIVLGGDDLWALNSSSNSFYGLFIKKQLISFVIFIPFGAGDRTQFRKLSSPEIGLHSPWP
jgi:hypothetical protein